MNNKNCTSSNVNVKEDKNTNTNVRVFLLFGGENKVLIIISVIMSVFDGVSHLCA